MSAAPKTTPEFNAAKSNFGLRGWLFVIYGFIVMLLTALVGNSITNLAMPMMCEMYGWDYTNMVSLSSIFSWLTTIFIVIFGGLLHRISAKKGAVVLGSIYFIAVLCFPNIKFSWQYALVYGTMCILGNLWYNQFNAILTSNWFPRKKGLVIGWTTMGLPLGAAFGVLLYMKLNAAFGMAGVYYIYDAVVAIAVLMCIFLVKDYPEQCGAFPDNDKNMTTEEAQRIMKQGIELSKKSIWTTKRLLSTKEVWLTGISLGIQFLFAGGFMGVMVPRMMALGYEQMTAVKFMTFAGIMGGIGSYVVGWIDAKTDPKKAAMIVHIFALLSCALNIIPNTVCVIISLIFLGIVLGGAANCLMSMTSTMWGRYGFSRALTVMLVINQIIGSSGTILVAQIAKRYSFTGSYIVVGCLAIVGMLLLAPVKLDSIKNYEIAAGQDMSIR